LSEHAAVVNSILIPPPSDDLVSEQANAAFEKDNEDACYMDAKRPTRFERKLRHQSRCETGIVHAAEPTPISLSHKLENGGLARHKFETAGFESPTGRRAASAPLRRL
jgi:hypothetical protein